MLGRKLVGRLMEGRAFESLLSAFSPTEYERLCLVCWLPSASAMAGLGDFRSPAATLAGRLVLDGMEPRVVTLPGS